MLSQLSMALTPHLQWHSVALTAASNTLGQDPFRLLGYQESLLQQLSLNSVRSHGHVE